MPTEQPDARAIVDTFCATLDPLAYPARMRALAAWVRRVVNDRDSRGSALRPLLDELDARGAYERRLAVSAAAIGGDVAFLEARLTDPDAVVRATGDGRLGRPAVAKVRGGRSGPACTERPVPHGPSGSSITAGPDRRAGRSAPAAGRPPRASAPACRRPSRRGAARARAGVASALRRPPQRPRVPAEIPRAGCGAGGGRASRLGP
ncbi:hypothetical protein PV417_02140 [Streptomyces sp. ME19-03-3]|nr:hypothetical protein [Streptomyces sp. ME19-03-3]